MSVDSVSDNSTASVDHVDYPSPEKSPEFESDLTGIDLSALVGTQGTSSPIHSEATENVATPVPSQPPFTSKSPRMYDSLAFPMLNIADDCSFFVGQPGVLRHGNFAYSKKLPPNFYRVTHEKSATPSLYEINDLHISHARKILEGMAFQALGLFTFESEMNLDRYRRHHKQLMKREPSSWVSVSNRFGKCNNFHCTSQD
jgi:hypothetical protein